MGWKQVVADGSEVDGATLPTYHPAGKGIRGGGAPCIQHSQAGGQSSGGAVCSTTATIRFNSLNEAILRRPG